MDQFLQQLDEADNPAATWLLAVATPDYTEKAVTGATRANPVVITATGHGFSTGDEIYLTGLAGMTELNGRTFTITVLTGDTFSLDGEDGTGHTAYTSGGTAVRGRLQRATVRDVANAIAGTPGDGAVLVGDGNGYVLESGAAARASLGLGVADDVAFGTVATLAGEIYLYNGAGNLEATIFSTSTNQLQVSGLRVSNSNFGLEDTDSSHQLYVKCNENLTADITLSLVLGASRTLTVSGDATVNQDYSETGTPQFSRLGLGTAPSANFPFWMRNSQNSSTLLRVDNGTAGTSALAGFEYRVDGLTSNERLMFLAVSGSYTAISGWAGSGIIVAQSSLTNGLRIIAAAGGIHFLAGGVGSGSEKMTLDGSGNLLVGTTTSPTGTATTTLTLAQQAGNPTPPNNCGSIFVKDVAGTAEVFVADEGGAVTQISGHPDDAPDELYASDDPARPYIVRSEHHIEGVVHWLRPDTGQSVWETFERHNERLGLTGERALEQITWDEMQDARDAQRQAEFARWQAAKSRHAAETKRLQDEHTAAVADWRAAKELWETHFADAPYDVEQPGPPAVEPFDAPEPAPYQRKPRPGRLEARLAAAGRLRRAA